MVESEPLLFNLSVDDWKNLSSVLITPAIALSVAYLLGADLLKVPFVETDVPYRIPRRILATFSITLFFLASLTVAVWLTLRLYPGPNSDVKEFENTFFRPLDEPERSWLRRLSDEPVVEATLILNSYDGRSDLRIFANNSRVFGTYQDCIWVFQCKTTDESTLQQSTIKVMNGVDLDYGLYPISKLNTLPLPIALRDKLRQGMNFIDIFSNN